jgi:hypothetical protein
MDWCAACTTVQPRPPAHYGYLATGVDGDATLQANHDDYAKVRIRARRLIQADRDGCHRLISAVGLFGRCHKSRHRFV